MGRSPGFGSTTCYYDRPIQTRFRYAYLRKGLKLATCSNSLVHYAKVRRQPFTPYDVHRPSTACRSTISGSISLPSPGFFSTFPHGTSSLSVRLEYLGLAHGRARFLQNFPCPAVLGVPLGCLKISHTGLSPSMVWLSRHFSYPSTIPH